MVLAVTVLTDLGAVQRQPAFSAGDLLGLEVVGDVGVATGLSWVAVGPAILG